MEGFLSSIDLFLDGCSVTHFRNTSIEAPSDACYYVGKEIARTIKDDGYFIITSDVSMSPFPTFSGMEMFVSVHDMIKSFEAAGLKLFRD